MVRLTGLLLCLVTAPSPVFASSQADGRAAAYTIEQIGGPIEHPWGVAQISENEVLVTVRAGEVLRVALDTGQQAALQPVPLVASFRQGGMLDVAYDPATSEVYLCYSKPVAGGATVAVATAELKGTQLEGLTDIFVSNHRASAGVHFGCRLALTGDHLFASLGDRGDRDNSQDATSHAGSIVRIDRGSPQTKNQVLQRANSQPEWLPEIYSIGHRNPQGLALQPKTGLLWAHEHGPRGGDEINLIQQNQNYGWPTVSYGKEYVGGEIGLSYSPEGFQDPLWIWDPSIAPSGMTFYDADMFPEWQGDLLVGALRFTSIYRVEFDAQTNRPVSEQRLFNGEFGRVRDVEQAWDGSLLVLSDAPDGGLFRVSR